jgi:hypothetical protein
VIVRSLRIRLVSTALLFLWAIPVAGQMESGHWIGPRPPLPDSLIERRGDFELRVVRVAESQFERELLRTAEALYPSSAALDASEAEYLERNSFGRWPQHMARARREPGPRWWWHDWGPVRLPYALTASAVAYHLVAMRGLSQSPNRMGRDSTETHGGSFEYGARVVRLEGGGFAVEMEARWSYHCGSLCGVWFTKTRRVLFDRDGVPLSVDGDGMPNWMVS